RPAGIARSVTASALAMVLTGAVAGLFLGLLSVRFFASMLYGVHATDAAMLALPCLTIAAAVAIAAVPAIIRAIRIDPTVMLRE
ncbi:MAG TPA: hypothetical protein VKE70_08550, partial [Candidatus Solibacter sp.]|nr:hypothetical protein [Candidatus Solibacter sp.]